jgi:hypothetical protein
MTSFFIAANPTLNPAATPNPILRRNFAVRAYVAEFRLPHFSLIHFFLYAR